MRQKHYRHYKGGQPIEREIEYGYIGLFKPELLKRVWGAENGMINNIDQQHEAYQVPE